MPEYTPLTDVDALSTEETNTNKTTTRSTPQNSASRGYAQVPVTEEEDDDDDEDEEEEDVQHHSTPAVASEPSLLRSSADASAKRTSATLAPSAEEAETSSSTSASSTPTPPRNGERRLQPQPIDAVFSTSTVKPDTNLEIKEEEVPPAYETAAADATPPYFDTTVITAAGDEEILVEGLPVGSFYVFTWNMLVSMSFQFIGFLFTYLLHTSHAGRNGSRAGLGITLIQYGYYLRAKGLQGSYNDDSYQGSSEDTEQSDVGARAEFISYFIMIFGWFIIIRSTSEYCRARKMLAAIGYNPAEAIV